ncbi:B12-binding domain-containing radical SAM protein [Halobacteriovorax marinus]|uniref:B12-binding domain-containing radical SAM protein n=1 Tax=Halobacteriovorax marinus TaxID=97084 RepID=UPI003A8E1265
MNFVLINPPDKDNRKIMRNFDCATESKGNYLYQPYDFLLLSSKIKEEHLTFYDCIAEGISKEKLFENFNTLRPNPMFIISIAQTSYAQDQIFINEVKEMFPDSLIIVFGDIFFDQFIEEELINSVDLILSDPFTIDLYKTYEIGKDQAALLELEGVWHKEVYNRSDLKAPKKFSITSPLHSSFLNKSYRWPFSRYFKYTTVFTAWGCPYSCSYCIMKRFPNVYRDADEIIEELKIIKNQNIREIYIGDRSFGLPRNNIISLLNKMILNKFNFSWSTYFHPNQYDPELLNLMKQSGCHTVIIGIESSDIEFLKNFGRHTKKDKLSALISHAKELGISICGDFIIGLPGQSYQEVLKTIDLSINLDIDYASFNVAAPLPGSSIRENAIKSGQINKDFRGVDSLGKTGGLDSDQLTHEQIIELRNLAVRRFYLRPTYLLKRISKIRGIQHFWIQFQEGYELFKKSLKV